MRPSAFAGFSFRLQTRSAAPRPRVGEPAPGRFRCVCGHFRDRRRAWRTCTSHEGVPACSIRGADLASHVRGPATVYNGVDDEALVVVMTEPSGAGTQRIDAVRIEPGTGVVHPREPVYEGIYGNYPEVAHDPVTGSLPRRHLARRRPHHRRLRSPGGPRLHDRVRGGRHPSVVLTSLARLTMWFA
jgi:hypothetical protein